jgi:hypothetical protein
VTQGDISICEFIGRGTRKGELMSVKPTGKSVEIHVCDIVEVRNGKVYRAREYMDMLTLMAELGAVELHDQSSITWWNTRITCAGAGGFCDDGLLCQILTSGNIFHSDLPQTTAVARVALTSFPTFYSCLP